MSSYNCQSLKGRGLHMGGKKSEHHFSLAGSVVKSLTVQQT